jgi:hypothetical protein
MAGTVSIGDVVIVEGDSGTKTAIFTVVRSGASDAFSVTATTADGSATVADGDYASAMAVLTFGAGINTQTFSVVINGDTKVEPSESFNVNLSNATNATVIGDGQGAGTISNDDTVGTVAIGDVTIVEGDSGTKTAIFVVNRSGGSAPFSVTATTSDGSATVADGDYAAATAVLAFGAGINTQAFSVVINGDTKVEPSESFNITLSAATNTATISDPNGLGIISNDDAAGTVAIGDVVIVEGDSGTKTAIFVVNRSGGSAPFSVTATTSDGSATVADGDYAATTAVLAFGAGVNQQTFSVVINGDTKVESSEGFNVTLSAATNTATISDPNGVGVIRVRSDPSGRPPASAISTATAPATCCCARRTVHSWWETSSTTNSRNSPSRVRSDPNGMSFRPQRQVISRRSSCETGARARLKAGGSRSSGRPVASRAAVPPAGGRSRNHETANRPFWRAI